MALVSAAMCVSSICPVGMLLVLYASLSDAALVSANAIENDTGRSGGAGGAESGALVGAPVLAGASGPCTANVPSSCAFTVYGLGADGGTSSAVTVPAATSVPPPLIALATDFNPPINASIVAPVTMPSTPFFIRANASLSVPLDLRNRVMGLLSHAGPFSIMSERRAARGSVDTA